MNLSEAWAVHSWIVSGGVFLAYFIIDFLFGYYTLCVTRGKAWQAACCCTVIYVLAAVGITSCVGNWLYVFPLAAGSWIGTYLVVKYNKND